MAYREHLLDVMLGNYLNSVYFHCIMKPYHNSNIFDFIYSKQSTSILLAFTGILLFRPLIDKYIVREVFGALESSPELDIMVLFFNAMIIIRYLYLASSRYVISTKEKWTIFSVAAGYLVFRLKIIHYWDFLEFSCSNYQGLAYTDSLLVLAAANLACWIYEILTPVTPQKEKTMFLLEEAYREGSNDKIYRREQFIEALMRQISVMCANEMAIAVGIVGPWGTGKTFFLDEIKQRLTQKANSSVIINFNPWRVKSPENITENFFKVLKTELSPFNGNLDESINKYLAKLVSQDGGNVFDKALSLLIVDTDIENNYQSVNEEIKRIGRTIYIVIDDLDRLHKLEVVEVVRLIRNTANFAHVIFLVAYDKLYVTSALEEMNKHNHKLYLEKIFQIELSLPRIPTNSMADYMNQKMLSMIDQLNINKDLSNEIHFWRNSFFNDQRTAGSFEGEIINYCITNKREANKLLNSFVFKVDLLCKEKLDYTELFWLEIIHLKAYDLYEILLINRDSLLENGQERYRIKTELSEWADGANVHSIFKMYPQWSVNILARLFPFKGEQKHARALCQLNYYDIYFGISTSVPMYEFEKWLEQNNEDFNSFVSNTSKTHGIDVVEALFTQAQKINNRNAFENILTFNLEKNILSDYAKVNASLIRTLEEGLDSILALYDDSIDRIESYNMLKNIEKICIQYSAAEEQIGILRTFLRVSKYKKLLGKLAVDVLKKRIETNLPYSTIENLLVTLSQQEDVHEEREMALKAFKEFIERNPESFVKNFIRKDVKETSSMYTRFHYSIIFKDENELDQYLNIVEQKFPLNVMEIRAFLRRMKNSGANSIEFTRGTIEFLSDENHIFLGSNTYNQISAPQSIILYKHPWHPNAVAHNSLFNDLKWIAHSERVTTIEEARLGDTYKFERQITLPFSPSDILSANLYYMVDNKAQFIINEEKLVSKGEYNSQNVSDLRMQNKIQILITNTGAQEHTIESNPYGIVYVLEILVKPELVEPYT